VLYWTDTNQINRVQSISAKNPNYKFHCNRVSLFRRCKVRTDTTWGLRFSRRWRCRCWSLGCNAMWTCRQIPAFRRNILPLSSVTQRTNIDRHDLRFSGYSFMLWSLCKEHGNISVTYDTTSRGWVVQSCENARSFIGSYLLEFVPRYAYSFAGWATVGEGRLLQTLLFLKYSTMSSTNCLAVQILWLQNTDLEDMRNNKVRIQVNSSENSSNLYIPPTLTFNNTVFFQQNGLLIEQFMEFSVNY
jgi:hypothetical protein